MIAVIECGKKTDNVLSEVLRSLNQEYKVTENEFIICKSDKIILTGEGEACDGARKLNMLNLYSVLRVIKKPILGIGLGLELMTENIANENIAGLGIFPIKSGRLKQKKNGTNEFDEITLIGTSRLFEGVNEREKFFFKGNYFMPQTEYSTSIINDENGYAASVEKGNAYGVQFYPELSGEAGIQILNNFLKI